MSAFRVGDRVMCTCGGGVACTVRGRVIGIDGDGSTRVSCDNGEEVTWRAKYLAPVAPTPPVSIAPMAVGDLVHPSGAKVETGPAFTLETATGADLDAMAWSRWGANRDNGETDHELRMRCARYLGPEAYAAVRKTSDADWKSLRMARQQLMDARDEYRAKDAALDTVRKFLGAHSFASCSLACNRELREVMAVVLRAIDAGKAGK